MEIRFAQASDGLNWPGAAMRVSMKAYQLTSFAELGLAEPLLRALDAAQYTTPTPIQAQAIPQAMAGHDIIGLADTGTGKTAAFTLPILHRFATDGRRAAPRQCRALVLCPTRELAVQIADSARTYAGRYRPRVAVIVGGTGYGAQIRNLRSGVEILVATPGRLEDLLRDGHVQLDRTEILVADEADRMLDLGFLPAIRRITSALPQQRQSLFFSATMPPAVKRLADGLLSQPREIAVAQESPTLDRIKQEVIAAEKQQKGDALVGLLREAPEELTLVFTRTKHGADRLVRQLAKADIASGALHGNKTQSQRQRILNQFRKGETRVLVATDIAARGIDIDGIRLVVNYDLPNVAETYVHRIGRTARAGATGRAVSFCSREERPQLIAIERLIKCDIAKQVLQDDDGSRRQNLPNAQKVRTNPPTGRQKSARQGNRVKKAGDRNGLRPASAQGAPDNQSPDTKTNDRHPLEDMPFLRRQSADTADRPTVPNRRRRRRGGRQRTEPREALAS